jgi:ATP-dependent Clp protease ATP-binding subunit ClpA
VLVDLAVEATRAMSLARLDKQLAERDLTLELTEGARELIAEAVWDLAYGARPLWRAIQRLLEKRSRCACSRARSRRATPGRSR